MKNIRVFLPENFQFLEMKFSIYLNRSVFVGFLPPFLCCGSSLRVDGFICGVCFIVIFLLSRLLLVARELCASWLWHFLHANSNILKIIPPKNENFQIKKSDNFHIFVQNIDCGYSLEPPRRGGSNEYPQSMYWAEIRKIMYTPVNPSFTI